MVVLAVVLRRIEGCREPFSLQVIAQVQRLKSTGGHGSHAGLKASSTMKGDMSWNNSINIASNFMYPFIRYVPIYKVCAHL